MKTLRDYLLEEKNDIYDEVDKIPEVFYHATIKPFLRNIKKYGLGGKIPKNRFWDYEGTDYEKIKQGFFVDINPDCAYSYVECSDELWDHYEDLDESAIILFSIKTKDMDLSKLSIDKNDLSNFDYDNEEYEGPHSFFYDGVIPFEKLTQENTDEY